MPKEFNVTGICIPERHYMVDVSGKVDRIITDYIENGKYFTINRARQYGKTTILYLLEQKLKERYFVISESFESADDLFVSRSTFATGLIRRICRLCGEKKVSEELLGIWTRPVSEEFPFEDLGDRITEFCKKADKKVVLMIDEVDKSSDNQIFLSLLGLLRNKYLNQQKGKDQTFQSVILAGVYDIKNLKLKLHPGQEAKYNSPWNIAANFLVDLSFSAEDIATMLTDYERDHCTGMDVAEISRLLYEYTSGYPYLVSGICQTADERMEGAEGFREKKDVWTHKGIVAAELLFRKEPNTLFDDMVKKLSDYPKLRQMLQDILFCGSTYPFERENYLIDLGVSLGFLKEKNGAVAISSRIFETKLYDLFVSEDMAGHDIAQFGTAERNQYVMNGKLQMRKVMEKFCEHFTEIYGDSDKKFLEKEGRKIFLLYLKPIINGTGNYYIEAQTRDARRTDIVVDYMGMRHVIELKIWRGEEYNRRGEKQLFDYLEFYGLDTGYLLSFNFNKNKKAGVREIAMDGKRIVEIVV